jgi:hypothetical protein
MPRQTDRHIEHTTTLGSRKEKKRKHPTAYAYLMYDASYHTYGLSAVPLFTPKVNGKKKEEA